MAAVSALCVSLWVVRVRVCVCVCVWLGGGLIACDVPEKKVVVVRVGYDTCSVLLRKEEG